MDQVLIVGFPQSGNRPKASFQEAVYQELTSGKTNISRAQDEDYDLSCYLSAL
jgi:hypothetical protein